MFGDLAPASDNMTWINKGHFSFFFIKRVNILSEIVAKLQLESSTLDYMHYLKIGDGKGTLVH